MRYEDIDDYEDRLIEVEGLEDFSDLNHPEWFEGLSEIEIDLIDRCDTCEDEDI
jgi:hypothetical protein